jgi:hypothetical protein
MAHGFVAIKDATYGGVYYTSNFTLTGAITWTKLPTTGLTSLGLNVFHVDPFDPVNRQYVVTHPSSGDNIGDTISMRNGGNWSTIFDLATARAIVGSTGDDWFSSVWPDPTIPGCLWTLYRSFYGFQVFRTTDYGANWTIKRSVNFPGNEIVEIQAYGDHVWIGYTGSVAYSPDLCATNYATGGTAAFQIEYPHSVTTAYMSTATGYGGDLYKLVFSGGSFTASTIHAGDGLGGNMYGNSRSGHVMWIDPYTAGHMRICDNGDTSNAVVRYTYDSWATYASTATFDSGQAGQCTALNNTNDVSAVIAGKKYGDNARIYAFDSETGTYSVRNGPNGTSAPYTDSVPINAGILANYGIWVGNVPVSTGVFVYADEQESADNAWATDIADYDNLGSPMGGDRASFRDMPADGFDVYHAEDVHAATPQIHAPWDEASPPGAGYGIISDGTKWEVSSDTIALTSDLHDAVTLDADAAAILDLQGAGGQEIGLDVQNENTVFAGPATAPANEPTFRALVLADLPSIDLDDLADVDVTGAAANDVLKFDGANWVDGRVALDELSDVDVTGADALDILRFNGATWEDGRHNIRKRTTITADTTLDDTYDVVVVDASGGDVTVTLPDAMLHDGLEYAIKRIDDSANSVTIHPTVNYLVDDSGDYLIDDNGDYLIDDGSTNLEGAADGVEIYQYDAIQVVADSDADSWWII